MNYTAKDSNEKYYNTWSEHHKFIKRIDCCLCGDNIAEATSHNARPVMDGRCCYQCNAEVVIPKRFGMLVMDVKIGDDKEKH
jgi:hypothetical protein